MLAPHHVEGEAEKMSHWNDKRHVIIFEISGTKTSKPTSENKPIVSVFSTLVHKGII